MNIYRIKVVGWIICFKLFYTVSGLTSISIHYRIGLHIIESCGLNSINPSFNLSLHMPSLSPLANLVSHPF